MNKSKTFSNNIIAASPVIGVMLMIVITVILAAAVASQAPGYLQGMEQVPSATFEVQIKKGMDINGENISFMKIKEVTGSSIDTGNIKIVTSYTDSSNVFHIKEITPGEENTDIGTDGSSLSGVSPYLNNPAIGEFGQDAAVDFGNFVLEPGDVIIAETNEDELENGDTGMEAMIDGWENVSTGDFISVTIVHMSSNRPIFASEVEVM